MMSPIAGPGTYVFASWLFLRVLGLIYFAAFLSLALQVRGLVGSQGILPAAEFLHARRHWGASRFWRTPTLCWLNSSDSFLLFLAWGGAVLSLLLFVGIAPLPCLVLLWVFYLSLFEACNIFLGYQWDILLLESGFLAIFLAPLEMLSSFPPRESPSRLVIVLLWWVLFRLMLSSGVVKLRSRDAAWLRLTALLHHYETQPLPTTLAWYAQQLPSPFHRLSTVVMFVIELLMPAFIFCPAPMRHIAAACFIVLMILIQLTGNYCFFNLLGIALSLLLLDDGVFLKVLPDSAFPHVASPPPAGIETMTAAVGILILLLSIRPVLRLFRLEINWPRPIEPVMEFLESLRLVNSYGLFSIMTTERPEIIVEGSNDGQEWHEYEFKWKPGPLQRAPRFCAPHQPRLDWQMWFAALGYYQNQPWFGRFLKRLLVGSPPVLDLMRRNPFLGAPPRFVRAVVYDYRFTNRTERRNGKGWWKREWRGLYTPAIDLPPKSKAPS